MTWICADCGDLYGEYRAPLGMSTWHNDYCDYCGEWTVVTESRDYGHPPIPTGESQ